MLYQWDDETNHTHLLVNRHGRKMMGAICHYSDGWFWVRCGADEPTEPERDEIMGHVARLNVGADYA